MGVFRVNRQLVDPEFCPGREMDEVYYQRHSSSFCLDLIFWEFPVFSCVRDMGVLRSNKEDSP